MRQKFTLGSINAHECGVYVVIQLITPLSNVLSWDVVQRSVLALTKVSSKHQQGVMSLSCRCSDADRITRATHSHLQRRVRGQCASWTWRSSSTPLCVDACGCDHIGGGAQTCMLVMSMSRFSKSQQLSYPVYDIVWFVKLFTLTTDWRNLHRYITGPFRCSSTYLLTILYG